MELERLSIELRPRSAWEALDLGVRLSIRHARAIYASWLAVTVPCAILLIGLLGIGMGHPIWAMFLMWWLRPAFDRVVLHVVSHAVFDQAPTVRDTLRALPRLMSPVSLFGSLTWRRLSMQRSLRLPVEMLEGLTGPAARQRRALISRRVAGAATWQCIAWQTLEMLFTLGLFGLCALLIPSEIMDQVNWDSLFTQQDNTRVIGQMAMVLYVACHLALEPIYVAGGFMLYLKRRNDLEAWDVELQFRRLAHRRATTAVIAMLMFGCVMLMAQMPTAVGAAEELSESASSARTPAAAGETDVADAESGTSASSAPADALRTKAVEQASETLDAVMQRPEFGKDETRSVLRWRTKMEDTKPWNFPDWLNGWVSALAEILRGIAAFLATMGRIGGWLVIAVLVLGLLYVVLRYGGGWSRPSRRPPPPADLAGFDIRPQSLPADVAATALQWLREGRTREAMSLLFRGALSALAYRDHVPFARGDTEGDCLDRVRQHANAHFIFLGRLLGKWQELAYAHRTLSAEEVEALCREWPQHFAQRSRQEKSGG